MKGLVICNKGIEDISALEIKELINSESKINERCVEFEIKKLEELCLLCYRMQSVSKVLLLLDKFRINSLDDIKKSVSKIKFPDLFKESFVVRCLKLENSELSSTEIEAKTGEFILDKIKIKVELKSPRVIFFVFINKNDCYLGIDFPGADLSKRDYKIFSYAGSLKNTIAYALFRISNFKEGVLLDPFCTDGSILIEAALHLSNMSIHFYNKEKFAFLKFIDYDFKDKIKKDIKQKLIGCDSQLRFVKACQKNAKIAGVNKLITFTRIDIEWFDIKFDKNSVDMIISKVPSINKKIKKEERTLYRELFYQAEFVLKENGKLCLICNNLSELEKNAGLEKFELENSREVWQGQEKLFIGVFKKKL
jgi:putative N6-adenine-specific DNA methylase